MQREIKERYERFKPGAGIPEYITPVITAIITPVILPLTPNLALRY